MNKSTAKKSAASSRKSAASKSSASASGSAAAKKPLLAKEPQSKKEAAKQAHMFLQTTDVWSAAYFNAGDLHCMERELFG
jgi:hypothetical protein